MFGDVCKRLEKDRGAMLGDIHYEEVKNSDTVFETTNREESEAFCDEID